MDTPQTIYDKEKLGEHRYGRSLNELLNKSGERCSYCNEPNCSCDDAFNNASGDAQDFISRHIKKHVEDGMEQKQAEAAAYAEARKEGYKV
jgi:hypothetical protein